MSVMTYIVHRMDSQAQRSAADDHGTLPDLLPTDISVTDSLTWLGGTGRGSAAASRSTLTGRADEGGGRASASKPGPSGRPGTGQRPTRDGTSVAVSAIHVVDLEWLVGDEQERAAPSELAPWCILPPSGNHTKLPAG